jgi:RNA polymerase sigma-70 factor (ECF subfamily)
VASRVANRMTDPELVAAMARGEQEALRTLSQHYGRAIAVVAERILGNLADAEEVAADVLWQAWREAGRFDRARGSVGSWLMMIARSRAIDRLRARTVRERSAEDPADAAHGGDPSGDMDRNERRQRVTRVMAELKDGEPEVLELAYFSDLSQSEIAARVGLPLGTVKTRMRTALIKLRDVLKGSEIR